MNIKLTVAIVALIALGTAAVAVYSPGSIEVLGQAAGITGKAVQGAAATTDEPMYVLAQDGEEGGESGEEGKEEGSEEAKEGGDAPKAPGAPGEAPATPEQAEMPADEEAEAVERFKEMDPRDIITEKAELAEDLLTSPWEREPVEEFVPETGRVDPLTRVRDAVPEDLKPPRSGETDVNQFNTYILSQEASTFIELLAPSIQVHNVLQIGLEKFASVSIGGQRGTLAEGQGQQFSLGMVDNIPLVGTIQCVSIATDDVVIRITVNGQGTDTSVSKDLHFIPR
jgi:hypothetical protein